MSNVHSKLELKLEQLAAYAMADGAKTEEAISLVAMEIKSEDDDEPEVVYGADLIMDRPPVESIGAIESLDAQVSNGLDSRKKATNVVITSGSPRAKQDKDKLPAWFSAELRLDEYSIKDQTFHISGWIVMYKLLSYTVHVS